MVEQYCTSLPYTSAISNRSKPFRSKVIEYIMVIVRGKRTLLPDSATGGINQLVDGLIGHLSVHVNQINDVVRYMAIQEISHRFHACQVSTRVQPCMRCFRHDIFQGSIRTQLHMHARSVQERRYVKYNTGMPDQYKSTVVQDIFHIQ